MQEVEITEQLLHSVSVLRQVCGCVIQGMEMQAGLRDAAKRRIT
ncbi:MAG: hypothetical protein ACU83U_10955 [Gammaproteobacteria bacterium]